ncbi:MAG: MarR family transcriptional regulator [Actinomycetota bacterium]|nr:MarR family transcriptional regulator [Actinomycetota bacterium]
MNNSTHEPIRPDDEIDAILDELDAAMYRLGRLMASRQAECFRSAGVPAPQYMVLRILGVEGHMRVSDIADMLGVKNPAASAIVQGLEQAGYASRERDETDQRAVRISLTDAGRERLSTADEHHRALMRRFTSTLSIEDLRTLSRIHNTLAETIARSET